MGRVRTPPSGVPAQHAEGSGRSCGASHRQSVTRLNHVSRRPKKLERPTELVGRVDDQVSEPILECNPDWDSDNTVIVCAITPY